MRKNATLLVFIVCLASVAAGAEYPAAGKLLVATEGGHGAVFDHTVILLLHYDENGAMGLVVNRETEVAPAELITDVEALSAYRGKLYWGGPVDLTGVRALLRSATAPEDATPIVGSVYLLPFDRATTSQPLEPARVRFYIGYAGWAPGQLDSELAAGSWHVVTATGDTVFADDPGVLWRRLAPVREYRAAVAGRRLPAAARSVPGS